MKKVSLEKYYFVLYNGVLTLKFSKWRLTRFAINLFISNSLSNANLLGLFHGQFLPS